MNKDAKIYVAGHEGLVGSALIRRLHSGGYNNIVARTYAPPQVLFPIFILLLIAIYKKGILPSSSSSECKRHLTEPCIYTISPLSGHMVSS
jgi:hypothetical protein